MAKADTTLRNMIRASQEAGCIVIGSKIEGEKIELIYETPKDRLPADLLNWTPRK